MTGRYRDNPRIDTDLVKRALVWQVEYFCVYLRYLERIKQTLTVVHPGRM